MDDLTQESQFEALLVRCQQEIQRWHENDGQFFAGCDAEARGPREDEKGGRADLQLCDDLSQTSRRRRWFC